MIVCTRVACSFFVVEAVPDAQNLTVDERTGDRVDVGEPSHTPLEGGAGVRDHLGVETQTGHDEERVLGAATVLPLDLDHADIDRAVLAGEGDAHGVLELRG